MDTWSLTKMPKQYSGKKKASSTKCDHLTESLYVEECKLIHIYHLYKAEHQGPQYKMRYTQSNRRETEK